MMNRRKYVRVSVRKIKFTTHQTTHVRIDVEKELFIVLKQNNVNLYAKRINSTILVFINAKINV